MRKIINMSKISRDQYLAFVEHYYHNGNSKDQRIGQAFLNQHHEVVDDPEQNANDVFYGTDDAVVLDLIEERYVQQNK